MVAADRRNEMAWISNTQYRGYRLPGPIPVPTDGYGLLPAQTTALRDFTGAIDTLGMLVAPRNISLAGVDFVAGGRLDIARPGPIQLTWDPVDGATVYHLEIWNIGGSVLAATLVTPRTSLAIPASLFVAGGSYVMILGAEQYPRGGHPTQVIPGGTPHLVAQTVSGRFHVVARCGDGIVDRDSGEECDDRGESPRCNADCTISRCGDGILNTTSGEACDTVVATAGCNLDCSLAVCGDGKVGKAEDCDDGNTTDDGNGCSADCHFTVSP